jgi:hypothetical protein
VIVAGDKGFVVPMLTVNADEAVKADGFVTIPVHVKSTPGTDDVQPPGCPSATPPPTTNPSANAEMKQAGGAKHEDRAWKASC